MNSLISSQTCSQKREEKRREEARRPYGARPNFPHWPVEKSTLFIQGKKVTSGMKQQLASQLSDGRLKDYIIENKKRTQYIFDSEAWREYEIAYKRLSKNRQVNISKVCFNLWHTGRKNGRYYGRKKSCCLCNALEEDLIRLSACQSIDACMNNEGSWAKAREVMTHWKLQNDFWTTMEEMTERIYMGPKWRRYHNTFPTDIQQQKESPQVDIKRT
jgi:hypothetical protein